VYPEDCVVFVNTESGPRILVAELFEVLFANPKEDITAGMRAVQLFTRYTDTLGKNDWGSKIARWQANNGFKALAGFGIDKVLAFEKKVREAHATELG
jgi:hypothetical protein